MGRDRVRVREWETHSFTNTRGYSLGSTTESTYSMRGRQRTVDYRNKYYDYLRLKRQFEKGTLPKALIPVYRDILRTEDLGNAYDMNRVAVTTHPAFVNAKHQNGSNANDYYFMTGAVFPDVPPSLPSYLTETNSAVLMGYGTRAVKNTLPTKPYADISVALGELREGLPAIPLVRTWRNQGKKAIDRSLADEYLNVEFGWKPLLRDIGKSLKAFERADYIWQHYAHNADSPVHRGWKFDPIESTTVSSVASYGYPTYVSQLYTAAGRRFTTTTTTTNYWFSGQYRYHIPVPDEPLANMRRLVQRWRKVYGLSLDPTVLWNLSPWSWLLDWLATYGDALAAITQFASDGTVLQYGYLMEHKIVKTEHVLRDVGFKGSGTASATMTIERESKRRLRAHPYGWGVTDWQLSERQWAILAALGLNRRP